MEKCRFCDYSYISPVSLFDSEVHRCKVCNFIVIRGEKAYGLVKLIAFMKNVGGFRNSLCCIGDMSEIDRKKYDMFIDLLDFNALVRSAKKQKKDGSLCNVCKDDLIRYELESGLSFYMCDYCGCIYVEYDAFKGYVESVEKAVEKKFRFRCMLDSAFKRIRGFFRKTFGDKNV